tara:strand:- start:278 stop:427 length:150 start_codon:yes stop_codon:yes gene_type:complete
MFEEDFFQIWNILAQYEAQQPGSNSLLLEFHDNTYALQQRSVMQVLLFS